MVRRKQQSGININARFSVRDFVLIISMVLGSGNFFWCLHHDEEIKQLRRDKVEKTEKEKSNESEQLSFVHSGQR